MDPAESAEEDTFYDATDDASDGEKSEGEEEEGESGDEGLMNAYSVSDLLGELDDDEQASAAENANSEVNNEDGGQSEAEGNAEAKQASDNQTTNNNAIETSQPSNKLNDETESEKNDKKEDKCEISDDPKNPQKLSKLNDDESNNSTIKNVVSNGNEVESQNGIKESPVETEVNENSSEVTKKINTERDQKVDNVGCVKSAELVDNCDHVSNVLNKASTTEVPEKDEPVEETVRETVSDTETKTEEAVKACIPEVEKTVLPNEDIVTHSKIEESVEKNLPKASEKSTPENVTDGNVKSEECAETNSGINDVAVVTSSDTASETQVKTSNAEEIESDANVRVASVTNPLCTDIDINNTDLDVPIRTRDVVEAIESVNYDDHTYYNDPQQRVASDISGRFPVQPGSLESAVPVDEQSDDLIDHYYDDVPGKTLDRTAGTATSPAMGDDIYENVVLRASVEEPEINPLTPDVIDEDEDYGWSSSEFESYEEDSSSQGQRRSSERELPQIKRHQKRKRISASPEIQLPSDMLQKLAAKLGQKSKKDAEEDAEDEKLFVEVMLNLEKHPPPELPPEPDNLTKLQVRRRLIVSSIVESEKSYTSSLRRIIEDYEKPLIEMRPQILSKAAIKVIFHKVREILQCHNMFHIELAEYIKVWHEEEKIGNVFTASFAKSMVFDVYSAFVNNFSVAMEMARKQARTKQAFAEFLKQRLVRSTDKLSLFGLIVKPVQRFPQFIMLLQDLLKHTPMDHHDRLPLQMALTELENLTQKLNETKRDSQSKFEVKKILSHLSGRHPLKHDLSRSLIRQDNVEQMECVNGVTRTKPRRLFLFNDQLLCVTVVSKETDVGLVEKFKYKWTIPVKEAEVIDTPMSSVPQDKSALQRQMSFAKSDKYSTDQDNPLQKEIDDMQHDIPIIQDIGERVGQLRLKYQGLRVELIDGIIRMLQMMIQQKNNIDKCLIQISLPSKSSGRILHTFQVDAPSIKHDWLLELKNTKLAHDPKNKPGWRIPENQVNVAAKLPLFIKALLIDVIKQDSKKFKMSFKKKVKRQVQCAIPVVIPSVDYIGIGLQHMWVCSSVKGKGQVSVVSVHGNSPQIVESFQASDSEIVCAELVPGLAGSEHKKNAFAQDTVWIGLEDKKLSIRNVIEEKALRGDTRLVLSTDGVITTMRYMDSRMYAGLHNGHLLIYSRDKDGVWNVKNKETVVLSNKPIGCMLPVGHSMWLTCGGVVHLVSVVTHYKNSKTEQKIETKSHELGSNKNDVIECMVKAGVGLLVSMRNKSVIHLYHLETFELLQDVNISSAVMTVLEGKDLPGDLKDSMKQIAITYMLANKGLLWVGTNVGCILTLPLPRLEGVPQIKGRPNVSYHAHSGPIKFLVPIHCGIFHLTSPELLSSPDSDVSGEIGQEKVAVEGATEEETDDDRGSRYSIDSDRHRGSEPFSDGTLPSSLKDGKLKWTSTPDLRSSNADSSDNLQSLYGSLLRGPDVNLETEIAERAEFKRRSRGPALDMMSDKADALQARFMQTVSKFSPNTKNKCATLPMLDDSTPYSDGAFDEEEEYADQDLPPSPGLMRAPSQDASENRSSVAGHGAVTSTSSWGMPEERHQRAFSHLNHAALSKALIVVSGGDGHINWSDPRAGDKKYEDICLLLWQCKL